MSKLKTNEIAPFSGTSIGIGAAPSRPSALLDIRSTTQGITVPQMTTAQRNAIPAPFDGLLIDNSDTKLVERYNGSTWDSAGGISSINGQTAKNQILIFGSSGLSPNVTQSGLNTNILNIPLAATPSVSAGLLSHGDYQSFDSRLFATQNILYVNKNSNPGTQGFNSIKDAVDSITTNSSTNPFAVLVGPGVYTEDTIVMKSFVTLASDGNGTAIIQPSNPNNDIIQIGGSSCRVQGFALQGATGASAVGVRITSSPTASVLDFITISNCTVGISCEAFTTDTQAVLRNIRLISSSISKKLLSITASGFKSIARVYSAILTDDVGTIFEDAVYVSGTGARIDANTMLVRSTVGVGNGLRASDGAEIVSQVGSEFEGFDTNFLTENVGAAPLIRTNTIMLRAGVSYNLNIDHAGTTGSLQAKLNTASGVSISPTAPIKLIFTDPMPSGTTGLFIRGDILQADEFAKRANLSKYLRKIGMAGLITGGDLSAGSGPFDVDVAAGTGFVEDNTDVLVEVSWNATTLTFTSGQDLYVTVDFNGTVQAESGTPDSTQRIILGRVAADLSEAQVIEKSSVVAEHHGNLVEDYLRIAIGPIYDAGSVVTEAGTRGLNVSNGEYRFGTKVYMPSGGSPITWESYYRDGSGGFSEVDSETTVDNTRYDDGTGTLAPLSSGYFAKHTLYIVGDGAEEEYFLVYSQAQYSSLAVAEGSALPTPPTYFRDGLTIIATIIVQEGMPNIIEFQDARPQIGFKATGVSASADHGNLLGLLDDDHPQYLLVSGTRAMSGDLNMGTHAITNSGLINGVDITTHAGRHLPNGADPEATAAPTTNLSATTSNATGTANSFSRSDHVHALLTGAPSALLPDQANAAGTSANLSRADHIHNVPTAAPSTNLSSTTVNAQGIAATFARSDHGHAITTGTPVSLTPDSGNSAGAAAGLSKADHVHNIATAAPSTIGTANTQGSASSFSRSDHIHNHGAQTDPTHHAVATPSANGFMSAADKSKLDAIGGSRIFKSGFVAAGTFTGNPKTASVTFGTAFPDTNYAITITGVDARSWTYSAKATTGFTISANANQALTGEVSWMAYSTSETVE